MVVVTPWSWNMFSWLRRRKILQVLIVSMILVAVVPVILLTIHAHHAAWENSWREIHEKHKLLAQNQAWPIKIYIDDHRDNLSLLAVFIEAKLLEDNQSEIQILLDQARPKLKGFQSLTYVKHQGHIEAVSHELKVGEISSFLFQTEACFLNTRKTGRFTMSGIKRSPFTGEPTIIISMPVSVGDVLVGVLMGELRVSLLENLRKQIKFGDRGHSVIIDKRGKVIAHPNKNWMEEMRNLSDWEIVQSMKRGESGVGEFYSTFMNENMVAGYAVVSDVGWGIMVPQPKSEIESQVFQLVFINYIWALAGIIIAVIFAVSLARWIARPVNSLAHTAKILVDKNFDGEMSIIERDAPKEILALSNIFTILVNGLQVSRDEIKVLNSSLQHRVDEATEELRITNRHLEKTAQLDFLTSLANRRHFEIELIRVLNNEDDLGNLCLLLLDVDNFKSINDKYGHVAGDLVLTSLANVLQHHMRETDLVARYAGDEFVARMRCVKSVALQRAEIIRKAISEIEIAWQEEIINVTVSIGVYCMDDDADIDMKTILDHVDSAMYKAKSGGRNCVVEFSLQKDIN